MFFGFEYRHVVGSVLDADWGSNAAPNDNVWSDWFFPIASALLSAWVRTVFPESIGDDFA